MASRWAYEALAVEQFTGNRYQKHFNDIERRESSVTYDRQFQVPVIIQEIKDAAGLIPARAGDPVLEDRLETIRGGFYSIFLTSPFPGRERFISEEFSAELADSALGWLEDYRSRLSTAYADLEREKDRLVAELRDEMGGTAGLLYFKRDYYNENLADLVLNRIDLHKLVKTGNSLIRKMEPVYMYPVFKNGRAHFYASVKRVGNGYMSTLSFNILAISLMTLVFYLTLQFSLLRRILVFFSTIGRRAPVQKS
jgi:hypothetical protein